MFFGGERYSLLVVSKSEKFDASLRAMLPEGVFDPVVSVSGLATAKRTLLERTFDLVLINGPLPEDPGMRFAVDVSRTDGTAALLLVPAENYEDTRARAVGCGVFTLPKPVSRPTMELALDWLCTVHHRLCAAGQKTATVEEKIREIRLVDRAKWLLIGHLGMSEEEAHRYIEKQAMDRCTTRREIAESILRTYA